jgi:hypothetical protein
MGIVVPAPHVITGVSMVGRLSGRSVAENRCCDPEENLACQTRVMNG